MNTTTLQWFYESLDENKNPSPFNRIDFYKEYFKNLCPDEFKITSANNKISIEIPLEKLNDR